MKTFIQELFNYNHQSNSGLIDILSENPDKVSERLKALFSHILSAHAIWNSKIIPSLPRFSPWEKHSIENWKQVNEENFNASILIIDKFELNRRVEYALSSGATFCHSVDTLLFQIINHSTYHRGQVATEMRQCGLEPLLTDWIVYKMKS